MKANSHRYFIRRGLGGWRVGRAGKRGRFFYSRAKAREYQRKINVRLLRREIEGSSGSGGTA